MEGKFKVFFHSLFEGNRTFQNIDAAINIYNQALGKITVRCMDPSHDGQDKCINIYKSGKG